MEPKRLFRRKIYDRLLKWKQESNGNSALLIEGARRYKTHASLDAFCKKFSSRITNERYLVYTKDYAREESVRYLPTYLAYFL